MAEKLVAFSGSNWTNIGLYSYAAIGGNAEAVSSLTHSGGCQHKYRRYFSVSGDVQSAVLNLEIAWDLYHEAAGSGAISFGVYLRKPDSSLVGLASHDEDAEGGDNSGSMQLCDDQDISANFTATGTYAIELWITVSSAWYVPIDDPVYVECYGWWIGPPSLLVTERFTKTVTEAIGGGEPSAVLMAGISALEGAVLAESYSTVGGGLEKIATQKMGVHEFVSWSVAVAQLEGAGLAESLERTYGYRQHDVPGIPDGAGLAEYLSARWETGNYVQTRDILDAGDNWETIAAPQTNWEGLDG